MGNGRYSYRDDYWKADLTMPPPSMAGQPFECAECYRVYLPVHSDEPDYVCPQCRVRLNDQMRLENDDR